MWTRFSSWIRAKPIRGNIVASFVVGSLGDVVAQTFEKFSSTNPPKSTRADQLIKIERYNNNDSKDKNDNNNDNTNQQKKNIHHQHDHHNQDHQGHHQDRDFFSLDSVRILRVGCWGSIVAAPMYLWIRYLDKIVPGATTLKLTAKKVFINQLVVSTIHNSMFYLYICGFQEFHANEVGGVLEDNKPPAEEISTVCDKTAPATAIMTSNLDDDKHHDEFISRVMYRWRDKMEREFIQTQCLSLSFWGPLNMLVFGLVPIHLRVFCQQVGQVCWTGYLSFVGHDRQTK